eukprot:CAMPEP_0168838568 /NCGR_PEP_ID=MMETSP0727-20121128/5708_1 /TAXON_ID=265536 /ORGANISM="Amphiprora sp., Strain CCMP467" /LENGTH=705 /DNA_ID=CAMNT_0008892023 /DNA_START=370 /DNA_END=2484 /DNA_ORIENTATION=-
MSVMDPGPYLPPSWDVKEPCYWYDNTKFDPEAPGCLIDVPQSMKYIMQVQEKLKQKKKAADPNYDPNTDPAFAAPRKQMPPIVTINHLEAAMYVFRKGENHQQKLETAPNGRLYVDDVDTIYPEFPLVSEFDEWYAEEQQREEEQRKKEQNERLQRQRQESGGFFRKHSSKDSSSSSPPLDRRSQQQEEQQQQEQQYPQPPVYTDEDLKRGYRIVTGTDEDRELFRVPRYMYGDDDDHEYPECRAWSEPEMRVHCAKGWVASRAREEYEQRQELEWLAEDNKKDLQKLEELLSANVTPPTDPPSEAPSPATISNNIQPTSEETSAAGARRLSEVEDLKSRSPADLPQSTTAPSASVSSDIAKSAETDSLGTTSDVGSSASDSDETCTYQTCDFSNLDTGVLLRSVDQADALQSSCALVVRGYEHTSNELHASGSRAINVFNSSSPTARQWNLGSPHWSCGGNPQVNGVGGRSDGDFPNCGEGGQGNILVLQSKGTPQRVPRSSEQGGCIHLEFVDPVDLTNLAILIASTGEEAITVSILAGDGEEIRIVSPNNVAENSLWLLNTTDLSAPVRNTLVAEICFRSFGGVSSISFRKNCDSETGEESTEIDSEKKEVALKHSANEEKLSSNNVNTIRRDEASGSKAWELPTEKETATPTQRPSALEPTDSPSELPTKKETATPTQGPSALEPTDSPSELPTETETSPP